MTKTELAQLDNLLEIADEDDSPLTEWECDFLSTLDNRRERDMTVKQAECFDQMVEKHLRG